jgi:phosphate:Na+ symporter
MSFHVVANSLGGLALFLLAMAMMTDGLKAYAGHQLKRMLEKFTSTPLRGVAAGVVVTGLVQHSGAVTVAVIGFVNAGLMTLRQALGVVFGTNIGTTMTAWLVSLVGVGLNIEALIMPLLALGVALRFGVANKQWQGLGQALAGFSLFFMGLGILQEAFGGLAQQTSVQFGHETAWPVFLLIGFIATVLTQSSSAALALVITAAVGGLLTLEAGAAAVIGANLGSTSTAVLASLKATANAKRLAMGHVLFNVLTGAVALLLFPVLLKAVSLIAGELELGRSMGGTLALFHTVFNVLGVMLILPLSGVLARWLEQRFRSSEEDLARPQYLDQTLVELPTLAVPALRQELNRQRCLVAQTLALGLRSKPLQTTLAAHLLLHQAIEGFIEKVSTSPMGAQEAQDLALELRISRYLDEAARLISTVLPIPSEAVTNPAVNSLIESALNCAELFKDPQQGLERVRILLEQHAAFEASYQQAKRALLFEAASGKRPLADSDALLDKFSSLRRLIDQMVKADMALGNVINPLEKTEPVENSA